MTIKMNLKTIKDKVKDEVLNLSVSELEDVPVKEIATLRKVTNLDLSGNMIASLPKNFVTLTQIVKLDLSKNMLAEIPEDIGEMRQLKYLDLYANKISRLPLSMSELKNLKWLDLKDNPLTHAVSMVAGPCNNNKDCQMCAKNIVSYLTTLKIQLEEKMEEQKKINLETEQKPEEKKKESKKKKRKNAEKQSSKLNLTNNSKKDFNDVRNETLSTESNKTKSCKNQKSTKIASLSGVLCKFLAFTVLVTFVMAFMSTVFITVAPLYNNEQSDIIFQYIERNTNISLIKYHKLSIVLLKDVTEYVTKWSNIVYKLFNETYDRYFNEINNTIIDEL
ncbi:leucine-rich repeat-containing protein 59-like isoform X2 [Prorops nasuta]|uniref:leucine-rich repeat-containing protein 59-like isoform X2 n=1 Tax=Prorops nasuta TaxID=863751 RepID=UPI0034CE607F